jgi:DNA replication and repair protein RecF
VSLRNFRSYGELELALVPGVVLVTGPNGVGKTNLLEAIHVGSQGFSPRTRAETRLVRFGERIARVRLRGRDGSGFETDVEVEPGQGKRVRLNGAQLPAAEELRLRLSVLAFTPDRLAVVKGGPIVRRAYFDRMLGRLFPSRAELALEYGRALAQRNRALRRVRAGESSRAALEPWTTQVAALGTQLDEARAELVGLLAPAFGAQAVALGLERPLLRYEPRGLTVEELDRRLEHDVERAATGAGPHLRDVEIAAAGRELRSYGSQGEQRTAVLALVLAEAGVLGERRAEPPLLLLDDVFSELDEGRRARLLALLPPRGQTVLTATEPEAYPTGAAAPALVVAVTPGAAGAT